jgi:nucleotide-binding universal stress UspA family protein
MTGTTFERIVVATDGSESSRAAVATAVELAEAEGARLTFVRVARPADLGLARAALRSRRRGHAGRGDAVLDEAVELARDHGVACDRSFVTGSVPEAIAAAAAAVDADLIVVGSRRRPFPFPSVARQIVRRADRPVLVAPPLVGAAA